MTKFYRKLNEYGKEGWRTGLGCGLVLGLVVALFIVPMTYMLGGWVAMIAGSIACFIGIPAALAHSVGDMYEHEFRKYAKPYWEKE